MPLVLVRTHLASPLKSIKETEMNRLHSEVNSLEMFLSLGTLLSLT